MNLEYVKEALEIQLIKMNNYINSNDKYFLSIEEEPLFYGNQTIIIEKEKNMVLKLELKISYEEIKI